MCAVHVTEEDLANAFSKFSKYRPIELLAIAEFKKVLFFKAERDWRVVSNITLLAQVGFAFGNTHRSKAVL